MLLMPCASWAQSEWEIPDFGEKEQPASKKQEATKKRSKAILPQYNIGAVPEVDGKVEWSKDINVSGVNAEALYERMLKITTSLIKEKKQTANSRISAVNKRERIIAAIKAIRNRRSEMNIVPSRKAKVYIATKYTDSFNDKTAVFFTRLASASEIEVAENFEGVISADDSVQIITDSATIFLPLADIIDTEKEMARLSAEEKKLIGEIERIEKKLSNEGFVAKAPAAVVEGEKVKMAKYRENLEGVRAALAKLK